MERTTIYMPQFTIGENAFDRFADEVLPYGRRVAVIHGEKAWEASRAYILPAFERVGINMMCEMTYGHDATYRCLDRITGDRDIQDADVLIAVGGGKCMDTVKLAADQLGKPVFTIPTIASNCAPVTGISVMYHENGSFQNVSVLKSVPVHCFIHPAIILASPICYLWAGIGDAMAKNVESQWSAMAGESLSYGSELGIMAGRLCFVPVIRDGKQALKDMWEGRNTLVLRKIILNVIITPGITSVSVEAEYNGGIAHALFYGLTCRKHIEKNHLHGEVVSYGTLVSLMMDVMQGGDKESLDTVYAFHQSINLPVCLADLELERSDSLVDVLEVTISNQELHHTPYVVSKDMIYRAILELESYGTTACV